MGISTISWTLLVRSPLVFLPCITSHYIACIKQDARGATRARPLGSRVPHDTKHSFGQQQKQNALHNRCIGRMHNCTTHQMCFHKWWTAEVEQLYRNENFRRSQEWRKLRHAQQSFLLSCGSVDSLVSSQLTLNQTFNAIANIVDLQDPQSSLV